MQTIRLDLAEKGLPQMIYAKQADVGRKFKATITDNGAPYSIADDAVFTI